MTISMLLNGAKTSTSKGTILVQMSFKLVEKVRKQTKYRKTSSHKQHEEKSQKNILRCLLFFYITPHIDNKKKRDLKMKK